MLLLSFAGSVSANSSSIPICLDLVYLPSGSAASTVDAEFFRRLRSSCYIISGDEPHKETVMRSILNSLLEGKASWPDVKVSWCFIYLYHIYSHFPKMKVLSTFTHTQDVRSLQRLKFTQTTDSYLTSSLNKSCLIVFPFMYRWLWSPRLIHWLCTAGTRRPTNGREI